MNPEGDGLGVRIENTIHATSDILHRHNACTHTAAKSTSLNGEVEADYASNESWPYTTEEPITETD